MKRASSAPKSAIFIVPRRTRTRPLDVCENPSTLRVIESTTTGLASTRSSCTEYRPGSRASRIAVWMSACMPNVSSLPMTAPES